MIILSLVCGLAALGAPADTAADYFPLVPGTVRTYLSKGKDEIQLVDKVGDVMDMGGPKAYPVTESANDRNPNTTYYRLDSDQAVIVAFDVTHPLTAPMAILKVGPGKTEWQISGMTKTGPDGERMIGRGESRSGGQKTVLGKKVDTVEVKLDYEIGIGLSGMIFHEERYYAKGVGLYDLTVKMQLGKGKPTVSAYKLISLEPPKGGAGGGL